MALKKLEYNKEVLKLVQYIKKTRSIKKVSGSKLSRMCGLSKNYITLLECGMMGMPRVSTLKKIADVLEVKTDDLLNIVYCGGKSQNKKDIMTLLSDYLIDNKVNIDVISSIKIIINNAVNKAN